MRARMKLHPSLTNCHPVRSLLSIACSVSQAAFVRWITELHLSRMSHGNSTGWIYSFSTFFQRTFFFRHPALVRWCCRCSILYAFMYKLLSFSQYKFFFYFIYIQMCVYTYTGMLDCFRLLNSVTEIVCIFSFSLSLSLFSFAAHECIRTSTHPQSHSQM